MRITDRERARPDALSDGFVAGCIESGIAETPDYNVVSYEGVRYLEQTAHDGPALEHRGGLPAPMRRKRPNLQVVTDALVAPRPLRGHGAPAASSTCTTAQGRTAPRRARGDPLRGRHPVAAAARALRRGRRGAAAGASASRWCAHLPAVGENIIDHLQLRCTYETRLPITINDVMRSFCAAHAAWACNTCSRARA